MVPLPVIGQSGCGPPPCDRSVRLWSCLLVTVEDGVTGHVVIHVGSPGRVFPRYKRRIPIEPIHRGVLLGKTQVSRVTRLGQRLLCTGELVAD